jgi:hypothetical protein
MDSKKMIIISSLLLVLLIAFYFYRRYVKSNLDAQDAGAPSGTDAFNSLATNDSPIPQSGVVSTSDIPISKPRISAPLIQDKKSVIMAQSASASPVKTNPATLASTSYLADTIRGGTSLRGGLRG